MKTQPLAHDWAADARVSFQVKGAAPCWARKLLWSLKYSSMSELLVSELDEDWVGAGSADVEEGASVVVGAGSSVVVGAGASLVVGAGDSLVVGAGSSELVVGAGLGSCGASDVEVGTGFKSGALNALSVPTKAECVGSALLLEAGWVALAMGESVDLCNPIACLTSIPRTNILWGDVRCGSRTARLPLDFTNVSGSQAMVVGIFGPAILQGLLFVVARTISRNSKSFRCQCEDGCERQEDEQETIHVLRDWWCACKRMYRGRKGLSESDS